MIKVENITKDYRIGQTVVHALRGVSLEIGKGSSARSPDPPVRAKRPCST